MVVGSPKFDGIAISVLSADFSKETLSLSATAGFVDSQTGETHGWTKGDGRVWSRDTMVALVRLRELMERDLAAVHLTSSSQLETHAPPGSAVGADVSGIGEHVDRDGVQQV